MLKEQRASFKVSTHQADYWPSVFHVRHSVCEERTVSLRSRGLCGSTGGKMNAHAKFKEGKFVPVGQDSSD